MLLDIDATNSVEESSTLLEETDSVNESISCKSNMITNPIPVKQTHSKELYSLQKKLEEMLAQCRTMAYLTTDTSALNTALQQCNEVVNTLALAATGSRTNSYIPPVFNVISDEFKETRKTIHCVNGLKRVHLKHNQSMKKVKTGSTNYKDDLKGVVFYTPGRPKSKRIRYNKLKFPRQVSLDMQAKLMKAAVIFKQGM